MTIVQKDMRGNWRAEDEIEISSTQVLTILTSKVHSGAIVTSATVRTREGDFLSHMMYQDFSQRLYAGQARCTAKNVSAQHSDCLNQLDNLKAAITAHYAKDLV